MRRTLRARRLRGRTKAIPDLGLVEPDAAPLQGARSEARCLRRAPRPLGGEPDDGGHRSRRWFLRARISEASRYRFSGAPARDSRTSMTAPCDRPTSTRSPFLLQARLPPSDRAAGLASRCSIECSGWKKRRARRGRPTYPCCSSPRADSAASQPRSATSFSRRLPSGGPWPRAPAEVLVFT